MNVTKTISNIDEDLFSQLKSLMAGQTVEVVASGISMYPTIQEGQLLRIIITKDDIQKNHIIVYFQDNVMVAHRVLDMQKNKNKRTYFTRGDNQKRVVEIHEDQILGVVTAIL
jgi:signal peptidase I